MAFFQVVPAARELLERHGAANIQVRDDVVTLRIAVDGPEEELDLAQVSCLVERRKAVAIRDELLEARIAGFSRETAIFLSRDPDSNEWAPTDSGRFSLPPIPARSGRCPKPSCRRSRRMAGAARR